MRQNEMEVEI